MLRIEWDYWTSPDTLGQLPESLAAPARALLPPLAEADVLDLTDQEMESSTAYDWHLHQATRPATAWSPQLRWVKPYVHGQLDT
jgi:hypothetical protein